MSQLMTQEGHRKRKTVKQVLFLTMNFGFSKWSFNRKLNLPEDLYTGVTSKYPLHTPHLTLNL